MTRETNQTEAVLVLANSCKIEIMVEQSCYSLGYCISKAASGRRPEKELAGLRQNF